MPSFMNLLLCRIYLISLFFVQLVNASQVQSSGNHIAVTDGLHFVHPKHIQVLV